MIWETLDKYRDVGLLIVRAGFGFGFLFYHGWGKLVGGPERWAQVGGAMDNFGIGFGHTIFGFMATFSESVGGLLVGLGLFFRPACALLMITMFVATVNHYATGRGTPSHAAKNMLLFVGLLFIGPGKYSLDQWISDRRRERSREA